MPRSIGQLTELEAKYFQSKAKWEKLNAQNILFFFCKLGLLSLILLFLSLSLTCGCQNHRILPHIPLLSIHFFYSLE
jgi:hypothetical protein